MKKVTNFAKALGLVVAVCLAVIAFAGIPMDRMIHSAVSYEQAYAALETEEIPSGSVPLASAAEEPADTVRALQRAPISSVAHIAAAAPAQATAPQKESEKSVVVTALQWLSSQLKTQGTTLYNYFKSRAVGTTMDSTGPNFGESLVNPALEADVAQLQGEEYGWCVKKLTGADYDMWFEADVDLNTLTSGDQIDVANAKASDPTTVEDGTIEVVDKVVKNTANVNVDIVVMDTTTYVAD